MNSYENIWELQIGIENSSEIVDIKKGGKILCPRPFLCLEIGQKIARNYCYGVLGLRRS